MYAYRICAVCRTVLRARARCAPLTQGRSCSADSGRVGWIDVGAGARSTETQLIGRARGGVSGGRSDRRVVAAGGLSRRAACRGGVCWTFGAAVGWDPHSQLRVQRAGTGIRADADPRAYVNGARTSLTTRAGRACAGRGYQSGYVAAKSIKGDSYGRGGPQSPTVLVPRWLSVAGCCYGSGFR